MILIFVPIHLVEQRRQRLHLRTGARAADDVFLLEEILPLAHAGRVPSDADGGGLADAADPVHLPRVEVRALHAVDGRERHARMHHAYDGPVLGRDIGQMHHGANAAGAGHVLDDDVGRARNVLFEERREGARIARIAAALAGAENPEDLLALVEVLRGDGRGKDCDCAGQQARKSEHVVSPCSGGRVSPRAHR